MDAAISFSVFFLCSASPSFVFVTRSCLYLFPLFVLDVSYPVFIAFCITSCYLLFLFLPFALLCLFLFRNSLWTLQFRFKVPVYPKVLYYCQLLDKLTDALSLWRPAPSQNNTKLCRCKTTTGQSATEVSEWPSSPVPAILPGSAREMRIIQANRRICYTKFMCLKKFVD